MGEERRQQLRRRAVRGQDHEARLAAVRQRRGDQGHFVPGAQAQYDTAQTVGIAGHRAQAGVQPVLRRGVEPDPGQQRAPPVLLPPVEPEGAQRRFPPGAGRVQAGQQPPQEVADRRFAVRLPGQVLVPDVLGERGLDRGVLLLGGEVVQGPLQDHAGDPSDLVVPQLAAELHAVQNPHHHPESHTGSIHGIRCHGHGTHCRYSGPYRPEG